MLSVVRRTMRRAVDARGLGPGPVLLPPPHWNQAGPVLRQNLSDLMWKVWTIVTPTLGVVTRMAELRCADDSVQNPPCNVTSLTYSLRTNVTVLSCRGSDSKYFLLHGPYGLWCNYSTLSL